MGANAQTSVPTFTAGEILTAANMNISARTGIPVFADSTARDAAFGGTGEKTLAEGQFAYLENTNATQYYDGSNWQAVAANGFNLITTTSFSAVSSFSLPTDTFTSTYLNYQILINVDSSAASELFTMRVRASGTDNSSSNYAWVQYGQNENTGAINIDSGGSLTTSFRLPALSGTYNAQMQIYLMSPKDTSYNTGFTAQGFYYDGTTNFQGTNASGVLSVTTAYDSATFFVGSGTMTGVASVYGLAK